MVLDYLTGLGCTVHSITIIPGNNYGHVELSSDAEGKMVLESLIANNAVIIGKRVLVFFCTSIKKDGLKKQEIVDFPDASIAKTGSLPGLYVFDDFISEAESAEIIKTLDSGKWEKLLNRRVQHFGYEFKYGTNDVN